MHRSTFIKIAGVALASTLLGSVAFAIDVDPEVPAYAKVAGVDGSIKTVGSDTLANLVTLWGEGYTKAYPNVKIEMEAKGSGTAPPALIAGTSQFGPMSRPMKAGEIDEFERKYGYKPTAFRTAVDSLAVFVNKDNPVKCLTLTQVDAIFSKTRKKGAKADAVKWGDVGVTGEWADKPISLYGRNSASGTYGYFKEVAMGDGDYKDSVKEQPGSSAVVQGVASDKSGIGYSGVGYKTADVRTVPIAAKEGATCYDATSENAYAGNYPITRFLYVYVNKNPQRALEPLRAEFIKFVLSRDGQMGVIKDGFYPLPAKVIMDDRKALGLN